MRKFMRWKAGLDQVKKQSVRLRRAVWRSCSTGATRCLPWLSDRRVWLAIAWLTMAEVSAQELGLEGTWRLKSVDSSPLGLPTDELPFFAIAGVDVEGFDGCNRFFGSLDRPGAIAATRRACPDAAIVLPLELNDLGAHLRSGRINGDVLTVPARGAYPASTYVRQAGSGRTRIERRRCRPGSPGPGHVTRHPASKAGALTCRSQPNRRIGPVARLR